MCKLKLMAILHRKEEKLQVVLGRLPKKYTHEEFVAMFIKLYSKDWGKIKAAYIKQSQDKEPGTVVRMPKPDLYLKQVLEIYLQNRDAKAAPAQQKAVTVDAEVATEKTAAAVANEETEPPEAKTVKKAKPATKAKKEAVVADEPVAPAKKAKTAAKKEETAEKPVKKTVAKAKKETVAEEEPVKKTSTRKKAAPKTKE